MFRHESTRFDWIIRRPVYGRTQGTNYKSVKTNINECEVPLPNMIDNIDQSLMHVP